MAARGVHAARVLQQWDVVRTKDRRAPAAAQNRDLYLVLAEWRPYTRYGRPVQRLTFIVGTNSAKASSTEFFVFVPWVGRNFLLALLTTLHHCSSWSCAATIFPAWMMHARSSCCMMRTTPNRVCTTRRWSAR